MAAEFKRIRPLLGILVIGCALESFVANGSGVGVAAYLGLVYGESRGKA